MQVPSNIDASSGLQLVGERMKTRRGEGTKIVQKKSATRWDTVLQVWHRLNEGGTEGESRHERYRDTAPLTAGETRREPKRGKDASKSAGCASQTKLLR